MVRRRELLGAAALWPTHEAATAADGTAAAEALLRQGGVVLALRHALAPGTFDPPGFRLDDCRTQRNLSDDGRAQARRIGNWFASRYLVPAVLKAGGLASMPVGVGGHRLAHKPS